MNPDRMRTAERDGNAKSALGSGRRTVGGESGEISDSAIRSFAQRIGDNVKMSDKDVSKIPNFTLTLRLMTPEQKNYLLTITDKKQMKKEFERLDKIKNMKERELIKQRSYLGKRMKELKQKGNYPNASPEELMETHYVQRTIDDMDTMINLRGLQLKVGEIATKGLPDSLSSVREHNEMARQVRDEYDVRQKQQGWDTADTNIRETDPQKHREMMRQMGLVY